MKTDDDCWQNKVNSYQCQSRMARSRACWLQQHQLIIHTHARASIAAPHDTLLINTLYARQCSRKPSAQPEIMSTGDRPERSRRRVGWGLGKVSPPQPTRRSGGASWAPPVRSGAKPWPHTHFLHILSHRTVLVERKNYHFQLSSAAWTTDPTIFLSLSSPTGGDCPNCPPWLRPWRKRVHQLKKTKNVKTYV